LLVIVALVAGACGSGPARAAAKPGIYVAPTGADTNPCSAAAPCLTFDRAYRAAKPGQTVWVLPGNYPAQRIAFDPTKSSGDRVVFSPLSGPVTLERLDLGLAPFGLRGPQHVVVQNMTVGRASVWDGSVDVTLQNLTARGFNVVYSLGAIPSPADVRIVGGNYGPCESVAQAGDCVNYISGTNVVIDGATIHDVTSNDLVRYHVDGMFVRGCQGCTIRNSKFWKNMITNIRLQNCCGLSANERITIENNWFGPSLDGDGVRLRGDAIDFDTPIPGLVVRNNSFAENAGPLFQPNGWTGTNALVVNNLMANFPCIAGVTYSHNVFIPSSGSFGSAACGPTDVRVRSFGYVDGPGFNYHLVPTSPALARADAGHCPRTDIDGHPRPTVGNLCDDGADQRRDAVACIRTGRNHYKTAWVNYDWLHTKKRAGVTTGACSPKQTKAPKRKK
jgi:hypothetical protein